MYREDLPASVITCGRPTSLEPLRPGPSGEGVFIKVAWGQSTTFDETCGTHFGQRIYCDLYSKDPSWNEANKELKELLTSYMCGGSLQLPLVLHGDEPMWGTARMTGSTVSHPCREGSDLKLGPATFRFYGFGDHKAGPGLMSGRGAVLRKGSSPFETEMDIETKEGHVANRELPREPERDETW